MKTSTAWFFSALLLGSLASPALAVDASKIGWKKIELNNTFLGEGCTVADFNNDGKLDIAAGPVLFTAPDWKQHNIVQPLPNFGDGAHGYSNSFVNAAADLNHDGWMDLIVVDFPGKQTWWFENPKELDKPWPKHLITQVTNNESPGYYDLFGDGKKVLVMGINPDAVDFNGPRRQMAYLTPDKDPNAPWIIHPISAQRSGCIQFDHGLGVGDVNKDGRKDVIVNKGWYEQPADRSQSEWMFHEFNPAPGQKKAAGEAYSQMYAYDFDGDGDMDILSSSAHNVGMWWHEQTPEGWKTHLISKACTQTHSLNLIDINGDGQPDFVTGERFWAHGPAAKGPDPAAVVLWFELTHDKDGKPEWIEHKIDDNSGVGTAFEVVDVDGDGLLDVVTSNKKGTRWFKQTRE